MAKTITHWLWIGLIFIPSTALATQTHGGPEGLYVHQLAHVCFIISMATLIYWLRKRSLVKSPGWRRIQYSAIFFILWNADAFLVHFLDEQTAVIQIRRIDIFHLQINTSQGFEWLGHVYYIAKLDHLLCVTAILFLYFGLKRLREEIGDAPVAGELP